ncbi:maker734 [Drosophila busckii]|uniref:Maker734 n=1 Tax=Drosophila busckii TaxID=30019 RepID=A0A0M4EK90_DROBS|nr:uncharacterized protein LOC108598734 [Drosophila busckii]ALC44551.1 maker734 [Drosophila busckii]
MAKIALVLLLVAFVAVCNAGRMPREAPATAQDPQWGDLLEQAVNQMKALASKENVDKAAKVLDDLQAKVKATGEELVGKVKEQAEQARQYIEKLNESHAPK